MSRDIELIEIENVMEIEKDKKREKEFMFYIFCLTRAVARAFTSPKKYIQSLLCRSYNLDQNESMPRVFVLTHFSSDFHEIVHIIESFVNNRRYTTTQCTFIVKENVFSTTNLNLTCGIH